MAAPKGNKFAVGNPGGGRPQKFTNAKEMYEIGKLYIDDCLENEKHITFTGLCIAMGTTKDTFNEYESGKFDTDKEVFSTLLKELRLYCENYAENKLYGNNPTGAIFALKNYGWKDKQEIEQTVSGSIEVTFSNPDLDEWAK